MDVRGCSLSVYNVPKQNKNDLYYCYDPDVHRTLLRGIRSWETYSFFALCRSPKKFLEETRVGADESDYSSAARLAFLLRRRHFSSTLAHPRP